MYLFAWFDFYRPKIPDSLLLRLKSKLRTENLPLVDEENSRWPKVLKQYIVHNCPVAYGRMTNHRVVFGLLRSLALLSLIAAWIQLFEIVDQLFCHKEDVLENAGAFALFSAAATLMIVGFAKFNRRFFEESVYAFVLTKSI